MLKLYRATRLLLGTLMLVTVVNGLYAQNTSDRIIERNVAPIPNSLKNILLLQPGIIEYNTNNFKSHDLRSGKQYGFLAENMQAVFPSLVSTKQVSYMYGKNTYRDQRISTVNEAGLIPIMVSAIQDLHREIETLKSELKELRK
jgi:hypothetical protein